MQLYRTKISKLIEFKQLSKYMLVFVFSA